MSVMRKSRVSLSKKGRIVLAAGAAVALVACGVLSMGAPRLVVLNNGIEVAYPLRLGLFALGAAAGALALVALAPGRRARLAAAAAAVLALVFSLERIGYRLEASRDGLAARHYGWTTRLGWNEISQVTVGLRGTELVTSRKRIALDISALPANDAAIINRTIARRISEANLRAAR
jgi:hypothetical protein